jgi:hypothetical protein
MKPTNNCHAKESFLSQKLPRTFAEECVKGEKRGALLFEQMSAKINILLISWPIGRLGRKALDRSNVAEDAQLAPCIAWGFRPLEFLVHLDQLHRVESKRGIGWGGLSNDERACLFVLLDCLALFPPCELGIGQPSGQLCTPGIAEHHITAATNPPKPLKYPGHATF